MTKVAVLGLGYVGLSATLAFSLAGYEVTGFDRDERRVAEIQSGIDRTMQVDVAALCQLACVVTSDPLRLTDFDVFVVLVQTGLDDHLNPDTRAVEGAASLLAQVIRPGALVILSSTVPIGFTEGRFREQLEAGGELRAGLDFDLAYAPERFDPGNHANTFQRITKIVSALDARALTRTCDFYRSIFTSITVAPSIKVAEASRLVENAQRDVNIAFLNDVAHIMNAWDIDTDDVLSVARSKWNFLPFRPGLVGGHCVNVHTHYLRRAAIQREVPSLFSALIRETNDEVPERIAYVCAERIMRRNPRLPATVTVLGLSYKENVPDTRGSAALKVVRKLRDYGCNVQLVDPLVRSEDLVLIHGEDLTPKHTLQPGDAVVIAVAHREFSDGGWPFILLHLRGGVGVVIDVHGILPRDQCPTGVDLWRL